MSAATQLLQLVCDRAPELADHEPTDTQKLRALDVILERAGNVQGDQERMAALIDLVVHELTA